MKANEFLKEHGIKKTKNICDRYLDFTHVTNDARMLISEKDYVEFAPHFKSSLSDAVKISDLKRIVESHELVEKCGGLNSLKSWVKEKKSKLSLATYFHCNKPPVLIQIENAEKAIADIESCQ